ncbi:hypothetical protein [Pleionea sediminis]|uniref:hypothetical protein n=1 Tax=Pleionea sediminis TaxID=2569479 RepID=UPI00118559E6|nr:hypothetical protein [Pleionea sediminis]
MNKFISSITIFVSFFIAGCTARPELPKVIKADAINGNSSLIVGSLSRANGLQSFDSWSLQFRSINDENPYSNIIKGKVDKNVPFGRYDFDFKESKNSGNIFAYIVPAGTYEIFATEMTQSYAYTHSRWSSKDEFSLKFQAEAGKIIYIGEYAIQPVYNGKNFIGVPLVGSGYWMISDKSKRDLALLQKKYPNLNWSNVKKDVVEEPNSPVFVRARD